MESIYAGAALALDGEGQPHVVRRVYGHPDWPDLVVIQHSWRTGEATWAHEVMAPLSEHTFEESLQGVAIAVGPSGALVSMFAGLGSYEGFCPDSAFQDACLSCPDTHCIFWGHEKPGEEWEFAATDLGFWWEWPADEPVLDLVRSGDQVLAGFTTGLFVEIRLALDGPATPHASFAQAGSGYGLFAGAVASTPDGGAGLLNVKLPPSLVIARPWHLLGVLDVPLVNGFGTGEAQNLVFDGLGRPHIATCNEDSVGHLRLYGGAESGGWVTDTWPAGTAKVEYYRAPALVIDPTGRLHWVVPRSFAAPDGEAGGRIHEMVHLWRDCVKTL